MNMVLVGMMLLFFVIKRRLWLPLIWHDTAAHVSHRHVFGTNPIPYFTLLGRPLGAYILSMTYRNGRETGNLIFDLLLTASGLLIYHLSYVLFPSTGVAVMTVGCFYFLWMAPSTYEASGAAMEMYSHVFSLTGLLIVIHAVNEQHLLLVFGGAAMASLGWWVKVSAFECFWPLVFIFCYRGAGDELIAALCAQGLMSLVLLGLTVCGMRKAARESCGAAGLRSRASALWAVLHNEAFNGFSKMSNAVTGILNGMLQHAAVTFPILCGYFIFLALPDIDLRLKHISLMWIAVSSIVLLRLRFVPLYLLMAQLPIALGASIAVYRFRDIASDYPGLCLSIGVTVSGVILTAFQRYSQFPNFRRNNAQLKSMVVEPLRKVIRPEDVVFQDTGYPQLYYELGCRTPPEAFWWVDRIQGILSNRAEKKKFIDFFRQHRPKYYLAIGRGLNLGYLEKLSGLSYEPFFLGCGIGYRLKSVNAGVPSLDPDVCRLLTPDSARYENDRKELIETYGRYLLEGNRYAAGNDHRQALECYDRALRMVARPKGLQVRRAECLLVLGRTEEALGAARAELELEPGSEHVKELIGRLERQAAIGSARPVDTGAGMLADAPGEAFSPSSTVHAEQTLDSYVAAGDWENASACFREALKADPDDAYRTIAYGEVLKRLDRREDARKLYADFLQRNPAERNVHLAAESL